MPPASAHARLAAVQLEAIVIEDALHPATPHLGIGAVREPTAASLIGIAIW